MSVTAFFEFVRLLYFADFLWGYKKSGSFAFFLVVSLQKNKMKKSLKKVMKVFEKRTFAAVYLHPHFRKAARQSARITAASPLHHRCKAADTL
jgi:hypothetical protein